MLATSPLRLSLPPPFIKRYQGIFVHDGYIALLPEKVLPYFTREKLNKKSMISYGKNIFMMILLQ
jgi:hypothetical protein